MTAAILGILSALIPFVIWIIRRRAEAKDDPQKQHERAYREIDSDIAIGNSGRASAHASDSLDELDRLQNSQGGVSRSDGNKG